MTSLDDLANELKPLDEGDWVEPTYDFGMPQDLIVDVGIAEDEDGRLEIDLWGEDICDVCSPYPKDNVVGYADYEMEYGDIAYQFCAADFPAGDGVYVIEGITGSCHADYYGEVDCDMYWERIRPATPEEIAKVFGASFWDSE